MDSKYYFAPIALICSAINLGAVLGFTIKYAVIPNYRNFVVLGAITFIWLGSLYYFQLKQYKLSDMDLAEIFSLAVIPISATATLLYLVANNSSNYYY